MRLRTNAKVNLFLKVLDRRPDGYHHVDTVYQSVSLADEMSFDVADLRAPSSPTLRPAIELEVVAPSPSVEPTSVAEDNLAVRAARLLEGRFGIEAKVRIRLEKRIPVAAGLAGGSANAAGTLVALDDLFDLGLSVHELMEFAGELGSDVPFCIIGGSMRATGRGEELTPLLPAPELWIVLAFSDHRLMTADVYDRWDTVGSSTERDAIGLMTALQLGDVEALGRAMHNDLEVAALSLLPQLQSSIDGLAAAGAVRAMLCGSGPTLLALTASEAHARALAEEAGAMRGVVGTAVVTTVPACIERLG